MIIFVLLAVVLIPLWLILRGIAKEPYKGKKQKKEYFCPQCKQPCTKEEYESGYCLDCDQIELEIFEEN